jgi:nucleoside-diphosphate-sugar epimerase
VNLAVGDVSQPDSYREHLEASHVIIHALLDRRRPKETDQALFGAVAGLSHHAGTRRRLIYTTGCSIFGKAGVRIMDEMTEPNPQHFLAFRREMEREALAVNGEKTGVVVVRPGFMYGNDGFNSQATDWFEMGARGEGVYRGDKEKAWSWVHIEDLAEAYVLAAQADHGIDGELFNLADSLHPQCVDVMTRCVRIAGYTGPVTFEGPQEGNNTSTWFDQNELITSEKANRMLGWWPKHRGILEDAPAAYAAWKIGQKLAG